MTVCLSLRKPNFIITVSDTLAVNPITGNRTLNKKFFVIMKRNIVILLSGHWRLEESDDPDPRKLLIEDANKLMHKNDTLLDASNKILELIKKTYKPERDVVLQLQVCGFDDNVPRIYIILTAKDEIHEASAVSLTGTAGIIEFGRTSEAKRKMTLLANLIPEEQILDKKVREFLSQAIHFENNWAKIKGVAPTTGGGVNTVIVYPNRIVWLQPRFESKDDPYKINLGN